MLTMCSCIPIAVNAEVNPVGWALGNDPAGVVVDPGGVVAGPAGVVVDPVGVVVDPAEVVADPADVIRMTPDSVPCLYSQLEYIVL